ncbi:hybrid sensor histidine kinase/response regulator [Rhodoferax koreense]|uniref:histidine kinase n=1 Tax=Rhodoferax koreensis TaxID=1842727 RepID=A0A1P8JQA4_9BURK|nr:PAS domain-containing protein [Rhodoferax koreense]APW35905.1 hybrid sensor histidine kinase/response regulator [Rhodoferax koreense]
MPHVESESASLSFVQGGGELGGLIAAFDWQRTELGPIAVWPPHVTVATALMLRTAVPMVMLWGESGVMVYNDAYAKIAGGRHPQLLGSRVREGWPEVADFNDHVMKVGLAGGTLSYRDQHLILHRNGRAEPVWMNLDYSPLLDAEGVPAGVLAVVVETTAKVEAERLLGGERERLAQLFEQAPSFMAMLRGPQHRIELANPSYLRALDRADVIGRPLAEVLPESVEQGFVALLDEVYATGEAFSAEAFRFVLEAAPGAPRRETFSDFVAQPIRDRNGAVDGIFIEGVDVTSRVASDRLRERLASLADHLRDLSEPGEVVFAASQALGEALGASRVGYGRIDHDAETLHVERDWTAPGVESLAGVTRLRDYGAFIDSLKCDDFVAIGDVREDPRTQAAAAALEGRSTRAFINVPVVEHGRLVAVLFVNAAEVREWRLEQLAFVREVAERTWSALARTRGEAALRLSEARLREANETLEAKVEARGRELMEIEAKFRQAQKMEAIGQLTGGIAHDFNNMLHGIGTSLEILQRRLQLGKTEDNQRYIDMAQRAVQRAASLTQRLLAFSRRQALDPRPTDVNQLIAGLGDLVRSTVGPGIEVGTALEEGLWPTLIDAPQLENALLNLCINARDAMRDGGGRLVIGTANRRIDAEAAAQLDLPPGPYVCISVADTGCGMTPEVMARAFDPFFTTKPLGEGTGLGLSMVYGFVRQSGGQVRIASEPGQGTTMNLYLPWHAAAPDSPAGARNAPAPATARQEVILLIEDDAIIRTLLDEELTEAGYRVVVAESGPQGLAVLQSDQQLDLLISDVGLPGGLSGKQIAEAGRLVRPALKVLFITGYVEHVGTTGDSLLGPGMALITKPFEFVDLAQKVRKMLD